MNESQIEQKREDFLAFKAKLKPIKIRANLNPALILRNELETRLYWVRLQRVIQGKPGQPTASEFYIRAFRKQDWRGFMDYEAKHPGRKWYETFAKSPTAELLHDPTLKGEVIHVKTKYQ